MEKVGVEPVSVFFPGVCGSNAELHVGDGLEAEAEPIVQNQRIAAFIIQDSYDELVQKGFQNTPHCLSLLGILEMERIGICHDVDAARYRM